jgi:hypothetical protein
MGDMILLPSQDILIINGAQAGTLPKHFSWRNWSSLHLHISSPNSPEVYWTQHQDYRVLVRAHRHFGGSCGFKSSLISAKICYS